MKARTFNIMQYEQHPETGEQLITEDQIKVALAHKTIKEYSYVLHDEDVYSLKDEADDLTGNKKAGDLKPKHWHIVLQCPNKVDTSTIAKWFGIPENFVDVPKGAGAFLDCVQYLTHEDTKQEKLGKRRYDDDKVKASFDFRAALTEREDKKLKYGRDVSPKIQMQYDVLYNGMTLKQAREKDRYIYMDNMEKLKKLRMDYIGNMEPPATRVNYYVNGRGGIGKGLLCRALARNLFPQYDDDYDIFFEVGAKGSAFEGYDGQPVIIWNDRRAIDLLMELNGRGNVFNVFDTHPTKEKQNIKYSSISLCNVVNIVNGIDTYEEFLDGLAGDYTDKAGGKHNAEDKGQSYRRFPFIIRINEEDFDLYLNKGFVENTSNFQEYIDYNHIRGNMQRIAIRCGANKELAKKLQGKAVKPITDKHKEVMEKFEKEISDKEALEIEREFDYLGADELKEKITDKKEEPFDWSIT